MKVNLTPIPVKDLKPGELFVVFDADDPAQQQVDFASCFDPDDPANGLAISVWLCTFPDRVPEEEFGGRIIQRLEIERG